MEEYEDIQNKPKPNIVSALEALDDVQSKIALMETLGFMPVFDENGNIIGWEPKKEKEMSDEEEQWLRTYANVLSSMSSRKNMALAWFDPDDVEPLTTMELELKYELIMEILDMAKPLKYNSLEMLALEELAKIQMKQGISLGKDGFIVKGIMGYPFHQQKPPELIETKEEKKPSLLDRLLGRA